jgi:hypothetical protein
VTIRYGASTIGRTAGRGGQLHQAIAQHARAELLLSLLVSLDRLLPFGLARPGRPVTLELSEELEGAIDSSSGLPSRRRRHPRAFGAEIHSLWGVLHPAREARARRSAQE